MAFYPVTRCFNHCYQLMSTNVHAHEQHCLCGLEKPLCHYGLEKLSCFGNYEIETLRSTILIEHDFNVAWIFQRL